MRLWQYMTLTVMGVAALALSVGVVVVVDANQRLQRDMQNQQARLSGSVIGAQGQQISGAIIRDMASASVNNVRMRDLLTRHGYTVNVSPTNAPTASTNAPAPTAKE
jgi:hypothetical protein